ncbi:MAG: choice-of-anchor M domain-containing protein [Verrucomicrobia bacterium]|nr:choice-of-anchor M domain-containing protein [Verrucomicrobiota bacterium]
MVTLSIGHVDGFEVHYDPAAITPEKPLGLHIHDDTTDTHYEPAEVILQVNEAAYGLQGEVFASASRLGWTGESGWVLPSIQSETVDEFGDPAMLFLGVANNPGDFAMYRFSGSGSFSNPINTKNGVSSSDVLTVTSLDGHDHWNWAFSLAGLYELDFQASGTLNDVLYVSDIETYTFNVIPEPSSGALLLIGLAGLMAARKRVVLKE